MTSQADFDRFVESQRDVRTLVLRDLAAWWTTVEHLTPAQVRREAALFMPLLAQSHGEVSATVAADFYEAARADSGASGRFTAQLAPNGAAAQAARSVGWATEPLFVGDAASAIGRMSKVADEASLQAGRDTVMFNNTRDPAGPRFARVPVGKTCAWCLMLASRGAAYRSAESAGAGRTFHADCDCQPVPTWSGGINHGDDLPPSYDEGGLYGLYDRARSDAGSGNPKAITAAIRRLDGGVHVNDGVRLT